METVNGSCYLGDRLISSGGCEEAIKARARISWVRFRKCAELLLENRFPLKMKDEVCCCIRPAILYGSETWCLKENKKAIFKTSSSSFGRDPHFQMLAVIVLSQHCVSTSKTVSPRIPVGAQCMGHVRIMCSAVCSAAPHAQFNVGARPHSCMND